MPETSTVRSALSIVAAVADLVTGREDVPASVEAIVTAARDLRPHQVEDVVAHVHAQYEGLVLGTVLDSTVETGPAGAYVLPERLGDQLLGAPVDRDVRCSGCGHRLDEHGPTGCAADDEAAMGGCGCPANRDGEWPVPTPAPLDDPPASVEG